MRSHLCGRTAGIPLDPSGRDEAQRLATRMRRPDVLLTSPVERACETAQTIGGHHGLQPIAFSAFTEFDFGAWTGRSFESLQAEPLWGEFNQHRTATRAPGGESMAEVQARALAGVNDLGVVYPGCLTIAIVSHGDVIRALLVHAAQTALDSYWRFTVDPASITELDWHSETSARIVRANDTAHLERT